MVSVRFVAGAAIEEENVKTISATKIEKFYFSSVPSPATTVVINESKWNI